MTDTERRVRYGGDYNPEQWSVDVWDEDVRLMQLAGVTTATVAVFAWARIEPEPGRYEFEWLDDVLERLHHGGIRVILATATASPPAWLAHRHPESLPVSIDGVRLAFGSRQQFSPSSSAYRHHAMRLVTEIVARYARHPAIEGWHVGNEYGNHVTRSYDPESAEAYRAWLRNRYGDIDALNAAWGTAFWSQTYQSFAEVGVPSAAPMIRNPTQVLDFDRFSSDALLALYREEAAIIRAHTRDAPVTTNFMGFFKDVDYWSWAPHVDVISDDLYPDPADPRSHILSAAARDLMRSLGGGKPWLLMEQATSAVNWRAPNVPLADGRHRLNSLQAVARGADGVLHFQWRQSAVGAEKFHSAMLPHAGEDTRVHRGVRALGAELHDLGDLVGADVPAKVAICFDWDSWRAVEQDGTPATVDYVDTVLRFYEGFFRRGVTVDFIHPESDSTGYSLVIVPAAHVLSDAAVRAMAAVPSRGDALVVTYLSGVVDERLHIRLGGYLGGEGALRDALGIRIEEFAPAPDEGRITLTGDLAGTSDFWQELIRIDDPHVRVMASFADGFALGSPAITVNRRDGMGAAWYVGTRPSTKSMDDLVTAWLSDAGVEAPFTTSITGVETVVRGGRRLIANHLATAISIAMPDRHVELPAYGAVWIDA
ncbi:beta-galactosidase [Microbacterium foliorum]|uniref:Beta-galactosidase n=1 Tax=Microbacterium foliorum TaxID=104336 RepID=A0ABU1HVC8_9MICO|nr:beta-galactosidase [Microbacterium foliorum]MDR6144017.1 beta-galactosidase [Microbacterium foliorum]